MESIIVSIIVLLVVGLGLYGVWVLVGRVAPGIPHAIAGIVLILFFLLAAFWLFGKRGERLGAAPSFRYNVDLRQVAL